MLMFFFDDLVVTEALVPVQFTAETMTAGGGTGGTITEGGGTNESGACGGGSGEGIV